VKRISERPDDQRQQTNRANKSEPYIRLSAERTTGVGTLALTRGSLMPRTEAQCGRGIEKQGDCML